MKQKDIINLTQIYIYLNHLKLMNQEIVWNSIAKKWADFRTVISPSVKKFLDESGGKFLDIGCGSGRNFIKSDKIEFYGIDFSKKMIKLAERRAKKLKINITLKKSNSDNLPFKDNEFDSVLCYAVLHCIDDSKKRESTIKEIYRVLKPGGKAFISSWGDKSPRLKNKGKECFVPWTIRGEDKAKRYTYVFSLNELENLVKKAGFKIIRSWEERNVNLIVKK